jgi:hypothetical protein
MSYLPQGDVTSLKTITTSTADNSHHHPGQEFPQSEIS